MKYYRYEIVPKQSGLLQLRDICECSFSSPIATRSVCKLTTWFLSADMDFNIRLMEIDAPITKVKFGYLE